MASKPTPSMQQPDQPRERLPAVDARTLNSVRILRELIGGADGRPSYRERLFQVKEPNAARPTQEPTEEPRFLGATLREFEPPPLYRPGPRQARGPVTTEVQVRAPRRRRHAGLLLTAAVLGVLAGAMRLPIRKTYSARGMLVGPTPAYALTAPFTGVVRELAVLEGDVILAGQPLMTVDPVDARAELSQLERTREQLEQQQLELAQREPREEAELRARRTERDGLQRRLGDAELRLSQLRAQRRTYQVLLEAGVTYRGSLGDLSQQVDQAARDAQALQSELANTTQQLQSAERLRNERRQNVIATLAAVHNRQSDLEQQIARSRISASVPGRVERVMTRPAERVEAGRPLLMFLPRERPTHALLEVQASERHALRVGDAAELHLDEPGLPTLDLRGRIHALVPDSGDTLQVAVQLPAAAAGSGPLRQVTSGLQVSAALRGPPRQLYEVLLEEGRAFADTL